MHLQVRIALPSTGPTRRVDLSRRGNASPRPPQPAAARATSVNSLQPRIDSPILAWSKASPFDYAPPAFIFRCSGVSC